MPAFSTWLEETYPHLFDSKEGTVPLSLCRLVRWFSDKGRTKPNPRHTLLVTDFEPSSEILEKHLGGLPAWIALPAEPRRPLPAVSYALLRTDANPMTWGAEGAVGRNVHTVATFLPWDQVYGQTLRHLLRSGFQTIWFLHDPRPMPIPLSWACLAKGVQRAGQKWHRPLPDRLSRGSGAREILDAMPQAGNARPTQGAPLHIVHYTGWLNSGGAERQLCNLARMQSQAGHHVRVFTKAPLVGRAGYYRHLLEQVGVAARHAGSHFPAGPFSHRFSKEALRLLSRLPRDLRSGVADLAGELLLRQANVLHCWLDEPNIIGFLAARIAGVPAVVLSMRNVSPVHMPHLQKPWMRAWYQSAAQAAEIALVNNSRAGARDYEHWLDLPAGRIGLARNAFLPPPRPAPTDIAALKKELAIGDDQVVLAGVFRLDPEKRPLLFLDIVDRLRRRLPSLRVLWAGCGSLEGPVREEVRRRGLGQTISLLGQRSDVATILAASAVTLLVSEAEGTPNVVLEAQHLGCVPVATDAGGTGEALLPGETGLLLPKEDREGLVEGVLSLLEDRPWRQEMARKGRDWVREVFDPRRVFAETMDLYTLLLGTTRSAVA